MVSDVWQSVKAQLQVELPRTVFDTSLKDVGIAGLSPHVMRRTFATLAIRQGASTRLVQVAGGWSNIHMVQIYTQAIQPSDLDGFFATNLIGGFSDECKAACPGCNRGGHDTRSEGVIDSLSP